MQLTATVTKDDVVRIIESFMPLRITIDAKRGRTVSLGRPSLIELVPNAGLRVAGDARITWDLAGVSIPVTIQNWQVVLVPRIAPPAMKSATGRTLGPVLSFEPVIEALDLKLVPGFLDGKIAKAIREGIAQNRDRIAWDFARSLSRRVPLPMKIASARALQIVVTKGDVLVSENEIRLAVTFGTRVEKRVPAAQSGVQSAVASAPAAVIMAPPAIAR